jgi:hypothetical protein
MSFNLTGCVFIAPPLHEEVESLAFVTTTAPKPELLSLNLRPSHREAIARRRCQRASSWATLSRRLCDTAREDLVRPSLGDRQDSGMDRTARDKWDY